VSFNNIILAEICKKTLYRQLDIWLIADNEIIDIYRSSL